MTQICPQCQGFVVGCPVCNAPPKRRELSGKERVKRMIAASQFMSNPDAPAYTVNGIDISGWNGTMNIAVAKLKAQYGFIRLGYGDCWEDKRADENRQKALDNDWPYGGYWYCFPGYIDSFAEVINEFPMCEFDANKLPDWLAHYGLRALGWL